MTLLNYFNKIANQLKNFSTLILMVLLSSKTAVNYFMKTETKKEHEQYFVKLVLEYITKSDFFKPSFKFYD